MTEDCRLFSSGNPSANAEDRVLERDPFFISDVLGCSLRKAQSVTDRLRSEGYLRVYDKIPVASA